MILLFYTLSYTELYVLWNLIYEQFHVVRI